MMGMMMALGADGVFRASCGCAAHADAHNLSAPLRLVYCSSHDAPAARVSGSDSHAVLADEITRLRAALHASVEALDLILGAEPENNGGPDWEGIAASPAHYRNELSEATRTALARAKEAL